jgi:transcriptional regulator with XRE-family HTH domain
MVKEIDEKYPHLGEAHTKGERTTEFDMGHRLRTIREMYGLSQRTLAKRTRVANGLISMIELNRTSPSVATLKKILGGFPLTLADFFAYDHPAADKVVYSAEELVELGSDGLSYRQVGATMEGRAIQILHERLAPGTETGEEMLRHKSEEGGVVVCGKIELTVGGQVYILRPGDAYYFDSRLPHRFRNIGDEVGEIVSCCSPPSF